MSGRRNYRIARRRKLPRHLRGKVDRARSRANPRIVVTPHDVDYVPSKANADTVTIWAPDGTARRIRKR